MIKQIRKNLLPILVSILVVLLTLLSGYLYWFYNQKINNLTKEKEAINQQYLKTKEELDAANKSIDDKNKEIADLKQAKNEAVRDDVASDTQAVGNQPQQQPSSIYDHIVGSDDFKIKIVAALNLLSAQDNEHFQIVSRQVSTINEYNNYGGYQERRDIYIGADANAAITGSIIAHEARHVYNVYVDKIYSYHTKEQELPCYQAELLAAQRLSAPDFFITSVQNSINFWQTQ
ncbi:MAG: hypothetical protein WC451_03040 [Patescibacteria group bacterium]